MYLYYLLPYSWHIKYKDILRLPSQRLHHWGKYHCTAGLQFYKFGFNCFTTCK